MNDLKKCIPFGFLLVSVVVWAALYGPFRCKNQCNVQIATDGLTHEFIKSTVNRVLEEEAKARGGVHRWAPGDQLTICDGSWCVTAKYSPMFGTFVWDPRSKPAFKDDGRMARNESHSLYLEIQRDPALGALLGRVAGMCLRGALNYGGGFIEGGDGYSYDGGYMTVTSSYREFSLGYDFCGL